MQASSFSSLVRDTAWTTWSFGDEPLYTSRLAGQDVPMSYENSFAYYQQECRYDAAKYACPDFLATVYSRSDTSRFAIMLPPIGNVESFVAAAATLCGQIADHTGRIVVLRKCQPDVATMLGATNDFVPHPPTEYDNPRELPEDIFPQVVLDTSVAKALVGHGFMKIRNHLKFLGRERDVKFTTFGIEEAAKAAIVVQEWAAAFNKRTLEAQGPDLALVDTAGVDPQSYTVFCERYGAKVDGSDYFGRTLYLDGELMGFCFVGRTSKSTGGLFVSLCMTGQRGASEAMLHDMITHLDQRGIRYLNLGGSEGERLFSYKSKWGPAALRATSEMRFSPST